jgi:hypothetical protein
MQPGTIMCGGSTIDTESVASRRPFERQIDAVEQRLGIEFWPRVSSSGGIADAASVSVNAMDQEHEREG